MSTLKEFRGRPWLLLVVMVLLMPWPTLRAHLASVGAYLWRRLQRQTGCLILRCYFLRPARWDGGRTVRMSVRLYRLLMGPWWVDVVGWWRPHDPSTTLFQRFWLSKWPEEQRFCIRPALFGKLILMCGT